MVVVVLVVVVVASSNGLYLLSHLCFRASFLNVLSLSFSLLPEYVVTFLYIFHGFLFCLLRLLQSVVLKILVFLTVSLSVSQGMCRHLSTLLWPCALHALDWKAFDSPVKLLLGLSETNHGDLVNSYYKTRSSFPNMSEIFMDQILPSALLAFSLQSPPKAAFQDFL